MSARFARVDYRNGHKYTLDGQTIPGVTTVIGKVLDKPALVGWAARETAAFAVDNWDRLGRMRVADRLKELEGARFNTNSAAIMRGNRLHEFGRRVASEGAAAAPAEFRAAAEAYAKFLDDWQFQPVILESPICSTEWRYGGTLDAVMDSPRLGRVLLDLKTGSGVWPEVALQLAAYRCADLRMVETPQVGPRGGVRPSLWEPAPMVEVDACYVAHIGASAVELVPVEAGEAEFDSFVRILDLFETWVKRVGWDYREEASYDPPIGTVIWPEDAEAVSF